MTSNPRPINDSSEAEKAEISVEHHHHALSKKEEKDRVDALATGEAITLGSFAHLDEKKILRKAGLPDSWLPHHNGSLTSPWLVDGLAPNSHAGCPVPSLVPRPWQQ